MSKSHACSSSFFAVISLAWAGTGLTGVLETSAVSSGFFQATYAETAMYQGMKVRSKQSNVEYLGPYEVKSSGDAREDTTRREGAMTVRQLI